MEKINSSDNAVRGQEVPVLEQGSALVREKTQYSLKDLPELKLWAWLSLKQRAGICCQITGV